MEALRSEVGKEAAVVVVLTELAAGGNIRNLGEGRNQVLGPDIAGLALQPAGVGGELGLDQDQGRDEEGHRQESQHHAGWWVLVKTEELCAGRDFIQISLIVLSGYQHLTDVSLSLEYFETNNQSLT